MPMLGTPFPIFQMVGSDMMLVGVVQQHNKNNTRNSAAQKSTFFLVQLTLTLL